MEKFQELRAISRKKIGIADHMLTQTYPLIQDPKLLLAVLENVFLALANSMGAILHYERLFKRIPPFQDNFDSKYNMFRAKIVDKYGIERKYVEVINEVKDMIVQHRKSPVEFTRKDKLVICNGDYKMKTISVDNIKQYIADTKEFIVMAQRITARDEGIFSKNVG